MKDVSMFKFGFLFALGAMTASFLVWVVIIIALMSWLSSQPGY